MDSLDLLLSRCSISPAMLGEPGPSDADLETMVAAALRAPDHGGLRPWSFAIVRGDACNCLGDLFAEALKGRDPTWTEPLLERERGRPLRSPVVIACGVRIRTDRKIPEIEQLMAAAAWAMNLLNAAHALGYGAMWVTGPNAYDPNVAAALGFAAPDRLVGFVYVGTPPADLGSAERPAAASHMAEWTGVPVEQAAWRSTIDRKVPRRMRRLVRTEKKPSTALSQEAEVGVKWKTQRGWRSSQARTSGSLCVA